MLLSKAASDASSCHTGTCNYPLFFLPAYFRHVLYRMQFRTFPFSTMLPARRSPNNNKKARLGNPHSAGVEPRSGYCTDRAAAAPRDRG